MTAFTPQLQLNTLFVLDGRGRIVSTREPNPGPGPALSLIRGISACAFAVRADIAEPIAAQLETLARTEPPATDFQREPRHAGHYRSLIAGEVETGPVFVFPDRIESPEDVVQVKRLDQLTRHFRGWKANELAGCAPIMGVMEDNVAVSVCFSARLAENAAEAGAATAEAFRGRGLAAKVTSAWAAAIRASGRLPMYSTSWTNTASLAVARKLGLTMVGSDWNLNG